MNKVELFIETIRESFVGSITVFTKGSCYKFYEILKEVYPQATAWYSENDDHVVTCVDGVLYDIHGFVIANDTYKELLEYEMDIIVAVCRAKFNGNIDYVECPNCDEQFKPYEFEKVEK